MKVNFGKNWGKLALALVLLVTVVMNWRWGYYILGNDNYSPELNPGMALKRYLTTPGWRSYRAVGVASDSDQADVFRTGVFAVLGNILPNWLLSQGWVFLCLIVGVWSMAKLAELIVNEAKLKLEREAVFLLTGLAYFGSMLTVWVFYSPLVPFMATWAFLPFLLWRVGKRTFEGGWGNLGWIGVALMGVSVTAIVPTIFIVEMLVVVVWTMILAIGWQKKAVWQRLGGCLGIIILSQLFWLLPFGVYVRTNAKALQESYINRMLTPQMVESEVKYNTAGNVLRYFTSWLEVKNDDGSWWFENYEWFVRGEVANSISYLILGLLVVGLIYLWREKKNLAWGWGGLVLLGWVLIKGVNPPFGVIYEWLQKYVPMFEQVFRWQSSKIWPFLATSMPLLIGIGGAWLWAKANKKWWVISIMVGGWLLWAWPLWSGRLIRRGNYVKVPQSYQNLAKFLKNSGRDEDRAYLAPEANTLYFRNHSWGFFGSSLMNYIIPNPIVKKAMTTGSQEAEMAQNVIQKAYYSEDGEVYVAALRRFGVKLVLEDRSNYAGGNGYTYDWTVADKVVGSNPNLSKVWEEGDLKLYEVQGGNVSMEKVAQGHDWEVLNTVFAWEKKNSNYYSAKTGGTIYPMMWQYDVISQEEDVLVMKGKLVAGGEYRVGSSSSSYGKIPLSVEALPSGWRLRTIWPILYIDEIPVNWGEKQREVTLNKAGVKFLEIEGEGVLNVRQGGSVWEVGMDKLKSETLIAWGGIEKQYQAIVKGEGRPYWIPDKRALVEAKLNLVSESIGQVNWCIWSEPEQRCLSQEISMIVSMGENQSTVLLDRAIEKGEKLTFYVEPKAGLLVSSSKIEINTWQEVGRYGWGSYKKVLGVNDEVRQLEKGMTMRLEIPLIEGSSGWQLKRDGIIGPEVSNQDCSWEKTNYKSVSKVEYGENGEIIFLANNCWGGMYSKQPAVRPGGRLAMLWYEAENRSGIPLDVSVKDQKRRISYYANRIYPKQLTSKTSFLLLPDEWRANYFEAYSWGVGPRQSINTLKGMKMQFIPQEWLGLNLVSVEDSKELVAGIGQAVSPSWVVGGDSLRINGWEQGVSNNQLKPKFWPDYLAWAGYGVWGVMILGWLRWGLKKK